MGLVLLKNVRGVDYETGELAALDSCDVGEVESVVDIRGKEGIEILKYLKGRE